MAKLSPDWRNYIYLQQPERVGIHKSILAALYTVHQLGSSLTSQSPGGGVSNSRHLVGDAINFDGDGSTGYLLHWTIACDPSLPQPYRCPQLSG